MKKKLYSTLLLLGVMSASSLSAAVIARFDIGDNSGSGTQALAVAPAGEIQWADVNSTNFGSVTSNGVTISISDTLQGWRLRTAPAGTTEEAMITKDFAFNDSAVETTVTFTGLIANQEYDINFWSYDASGNNNRSATWSLTGGTSLTNVFYGPTSGATTPYTLNGIASTLGQLEVKVTAGTLRMNGFELVAVPEPSTFALVGLAGLALLRRRRA